MYFIGQECENQKEYRTVMIQMFYGCFVYVFIYSVNHNAVDARFVTEVTIISRIV
jgi:hypothetical protein